PVTLRAIHTSPNAPRPMRRSVSWSRMSGGVRVEPGMGVHVHGSASKVQGSKFKPPVKPHPISTRQPTASS
ncbi:MAG: hypothetical protein ACK56I_12370, partial [bacterium]